MARSFALQGFGPPNTGYTACSASCLSTLYMVNSFHFTRRRQALPAARVAYHPFEDVGALQGAIGSQHKTLTRVLVQGR